MNIGYKVRIYREVKGFKQEHIAEKLNITQSYYSKLEAKGDKMTFEQLKVISRVFDVDPMDILSFDEKHVFSKSNHDNSITNSPPPSNAYQLCKSFMKIKLKT
jgi:transcriptional regulator with XRE-family HTH domain